MLAVVPVSVMRVMIELAKTLRFAGMLVTVPA
jgi:hypothetical protein